MKSVTALKSLCIGTQTKREQSIETPDLVWDRLDTFWGKGSYYDPCPLNGSGGLSSPWPEQSYCNPPYVELRRWFEHGQHFNEVIWLVPVRTHRVWFRDWWNLLDVRLGLDPLCFKGFDSTFPAPLMLGYRGDRRDEFYLAFHQLGGLLDESVNTKKFRGKIMELKGRRHKGKCHVKDCKALSVASAKSASFFSARGKDVELCEACLLEAQDMATRQGKELEWREHETKAEIATVAQEKSLRSELAAEETEASGLLEEIKAFSISTKDETVFAANLLAEIKGETKRLKAREKEIVGPMNDAISATRALFKPALAFYAEAENALKAALVSAHEAAQASQQLALESGDVQAATEAADLARADGVQYRSRWTYEIADPDAVPREYCTPDRKLITAAVKADHTVEIPGVRVWEDISVASKSA